MSREPSSAVGASQSNPCRPLLRGAGLVAFALLGSTVIAQSTVPPGPNALAFPDDWAKGELYATVDRPDTKQYREFYTSPEAVRAAKAGEAIPFGTVISLAAWAAKLDADGKPLKDANGRFMKEKLLAVNSMKKDRGLGDSIPAPIRNGDWIYQSFTPDGKVNEKANLTACYQCHLPFAKDDYLTNLAKLAGKFPSSATVAASAAPGGVTITGFSFGPDTIKVAAGDRITWTNADDTPHQVTIAGAGGRRSDLMLKGQSATLQFDEAGNIVDYICGLHPGMKGRIEVVAR